MIMYGTSLFMSSKTEGLILFLSSGKIVLGNKIYRRIVKRDVSASTLHERVVYLHNAAGLPRYLVQDIYRLIIFVLIVFRFL